MKGLIFTYVLTYGGAAASLFNPFWGLLVYVCFAIIKPEAAWHWVVPPGNYSRIVAIALLLGWVVQGCGSWKLGRAKWIVVLLVLFWLWTLLTVSFAMETRRAFTYFEELSKIVLPFLVGITTIDSLKKVKALAWTLVLSEGYVAFEFNMDYFAGYNRLMLEGYGNMDNNCNAIALVSCVGLAFFLGLQVERWWQKFVAFFAWLWIVHAILFSFSRGGMLALLITMLVSFLLIPKKIHHYVIFLAALALIIRLAGPMVVDRFNTSFADAEHRDESADSRLRLWSACWDSMRNHPFGIGPDQWGLIVERYGFQPGKQAHSLWLQLGVELGFPGLILLVSFYATTLQKLWPLTREKTPVADPWFRYFARMVVASLVGFCVSAQFVTLQGLEHPYYVVLIGASILKLSPSKQPAWSRRPHRTSILSDRWNRLAPRLPQVS